LTPRNALLFLLFNALVFESAAQDTKPKKNKKPDQQPATQVLVVLKDPPGAAVGETNRLVFHVSPLTSKGLLSVQVHEALKTLLQDNRGAAIVKLRAFVAGSGDLRRVQTLVSEVFSERKLNIPALSTIQVGALPMDGAQVVIESIAEDKKGDKKTANPNGLAFFSGQQTKDVNQSIAQLRTAMDSAGVSRENVLRTTCFLSSLEDISGSKTAIGTAFPSAAVNFVQQQRLGLDQVVECEAVGRLEKSPASSNENGPVTLVNPPALAQNPNYSQIALVSASKIVFTGTQMAFGDQDKDVRLAFDRLRKVLEAQGVSYRDVFWSATYPLTKTMADRVRAIRFDYYARSHPPASTLLLFEGLPSLDATAAVEVAAVAK
jgi:enamine deaminase RidA (YjgF/YER057c/UK114 family)